LNAAFEALSPRRQRILLAAFCFTAAFALYVKTLSPAFHPDDSPETITAGATLSFQHPPGYPLHSLLGRLATLLGPGGPAFNVNLLAAVGGALAVALAFLCFLRLLKALELEERWSATVAAAAALVLASTQTFWFQSTIAKGGIYSLNLALTMATLICVLRVRAAGLSCSLDQLRGTGGFEGKGFSCGCPDPAALRLAGLFFGLGLANHWTSQVVLLPGYSILLAESRFVRDGWPRPAKLLRMALLPLLFMALGLSLYLYLPLRSAQGAPLVWGDPGSWKGFWWIFNRSQYAGVEAGKTVRNFLDLMAYIGRLVLADWSLPGALALAAGWILLLRQKLWLGLGLLALPLGLAVAVAWKANPPLDSFFIIDPYLVPVHVGLGMGLVGLALWPPLRRALAPALLGGALALGAWQWRVCDHAFDFMGYDYVNNLLLSTPRNAMLFCEGDSNTAGPLYTRFVAGKRPDVAVLSVVLSDYEWYRNSLRRQDPSLKLPPQAMGPGGNLAWMAQNNPGRPAVWTNSYSKAWASEATLLHRGLVLVRQSHGQAPWPKAALLANRMFSAYSLRGVFKPYQRRQDPITVRLVQDNYIEGQARLAQALLASQAPAEAEREYTLLGRLKPAWAAPWLQAGNAAYARKDLEAAGRYWKRAVAEDPSVAEAQANLGLYYFDRKDFDQALSYSRKALALNPSLANAQQLQALALQRATGGPALGTATAPAQAALALAQKGDAFAAAGKPAEALAAYDRAVAGGYSNAAVHRNRAVMLGRLNRPAEAAAALRLALQAEPRNPELLRYLGIMLFNAGDKKGGLEALHESAKLDPGNAETQAVLKQAGGMP
jgi:tetratricopeptide (TPR) repeat protein